MLCRKRATSILLLAFLLLQVANLSSANDIETRPQIYEVPEGSNLTLNCLVKDDPISDRTVWWKIKSDGQRDVIYVGKFKITREQHIGRRFLNNSLEILNVNKEDEGSYECMHTVGAGNMVTHKLVIQNKPTMDQNSQTSTVLDNNQMTGNCKAEGVPKP